MQYLFRFLLIAMAAACLPVAMACRCEPQNVETYYQRADIVMRVELTTETPATDTMLGPHFRFGFKLVEGYKGRVDDIRNVKTAISPTACGMQLSAGDELWVFGHFREEDPVSIWVDSCSGSAAMGQPVGLTPADRVNRKLTALTGTQAPKH